MIWHVIRHGKTVANEKKLYCGRTDVSLSDNGKKELIKLKSAIHYPEAELYIVSGLKRTAETLECLYGKKDFHVFKEFAEMDFGDFEMKSYDELRLDEDYRKWISDIPHTACKGGEGEKQFKARVNQGLTLIEELCRLKDIQSVVLITHGGVISAMMESFFPDCKNFYEWQPECGRGYTIQNNDGQVIYKAI